METILFISTAFLTFFVFGAINYWMIKRFTGPESGHSHIAAIIGLGSAPILNALFLYYGLWLFPGQNAVTYFMADLLIWALLFLAFAPSPAHIIRTVGRFFAQNSPILMVGGLLVLVGWIFYVLNRPFTEHDPLEYATLADGISDAKAIVYQKTTYFPKNGFCFVGLHAFAFPLQQVWGNLINEPFGFRNTWFLQSVNGFYAAIFLGLAYRFFCLFDPKKAVWAVALLVIPYGYLLNYFRFHVDTLRLFLFAASVLLSLHYFQKRDVRILPLLVIACGFHSFVHTLGVFLSAILLATFYLMLPRPDRPGLPWLAGLFVLYLLAGPVHYIMDTWKGTGWIFRSFDFI